MGSKWDYWFWGTLLTSLGFAISLEIDKSHETLIFIPIFVLVIGLLVFVVEENLFNNKKEVQNE